MKKAFFWMGLVVAAAAGIVFYLYKDRFVQTVQKDDESEADKEILYDVEEQFVQEKVEVRTTLSERHKEAAQIIRETLEEPADEDSRYKVDFDEIDSKLDELLDEDEE